MSVDDVFDKCEYCENLRENDERDEDCGEDTVYYCDMTSEEISDPEYHGCVFFYPDSSKNGRTNRRFYCKECANYDDCNDNNRGIRLVHDADGFMYPCVRWTENTENE